MIVKMEKETKCIEIGCNKTMQRKLELLKIIIKEQKEIVLKQTHKNDINRLFRFNELNEEENLKLILEDLETDIRYILAELK